jgi:hypothetical protein
MTDSAAENRRRSRDRDHGMHRNNTRRDFWNGIAVGIGGALTTPGLVNCSCLNACTPLRNGGDFAVLACLTPRQTRWSPHGRFCRGRPPKARGGRPQCQVAFRYTLAVSRRTGSCHPRRPTPELAIFLAGRRRYKTLYQRQFPEVSLAGFA